MQLVAPFLPALRATLCPGRPPQPRLQRRLVRWRTLLAGVTRAVDYCGAMLNYFVVGAAVFSGELACEQRACGVPPAPLPRSTTDLCSPGVFAAH